MTSTFSVQVGFKYIIICVVRITNFVLSTYLYLQIPRYEYFCDTAFHPRPESAVRPGLHIAARGFERTIVIIAEPRYGACRYGKRNGHA